VFPRKQRGTWLHHLATIRTITHGPAAIDGTTRRASSATSQRRLRCRRIHPPATAWAATCRSGGQRTSFMLS
jgi:hypothetical protein